MSPKPLKYQHEVARRRKGQARKAGHCRLCLLLKPTENEKGTTLVIAILMLALLTFLGLAALNTATTEIRISANDKFYKQAFFNAEKGISYAVQRGVAFFPLDNGTFNNVVLPVGLSTDFTLEYMIYAVGLGPKRVEIRSTGTAPGGGRSVIIAGIVGIVAGQQQGVPPGGPPPY